MTDYLHKFAKSLAVSYAEFLSSIFLTHEQARNVAHPTIRILQDFGSSLKALSSTY